MQRTLSVEFVDWLLRLCLVLRLLCFHPFRFVLSRRMAEDSVQQVALSGQRPYAIRQPRIERCDDGHLHCDTYRINTTKPRSKGRDPSLDDKKVFKSRHGTRSCKH